MNKCKPGSQRQSPADLQGAWKSLHRLEHDQCVVVAKASWSEGVIAPRCVRMLWEGLSAESKG